MKKLFIFQNLAALHLIEQSGEIHSGSDIILYNGAWPKLGKYISTNYKGCRFIPIPTVRELSLRSDGKKIRSGTFFSSISICAEIKRGYLDFDIACSLEGWLLENLPNDEETSFEIVCYNRHCLLPSILIQDELKHHLNISCIKEVEINNLLKDRFKLTAFDINDVKSAPVILKNFYGKRQLNHFTDVAILVKNQLLNYRTPLSPHLPYVLDRALGYITINCIRKLRQLFPWSVAPLRANNVFVCQVSDDTSLKMTVDEYFQCVSYLCAEKHLENEKIVLSIHPKERSIKSLIRYFKTALNSSASVSFQTVDEIIKYQKSNSLSDLNFYYMTSTAFEKYGSEPGCFWRKLDVGK
jgi:hypothetical protein